MKSKKKLFIELLNANKNILRCPHCFEVLGVDQTDLKCMNHHSFNISKKGTITLIKSTNLKKDDVYNKDLFTARRQFIETGFYDRVHLKLKSYVHHDDVWCDMGCGEGSHGLKIIKDSKSLMLALDLSKPAIEMASDGLIEKLVPIVADLANMPIKDNSVDGIVNFLSPSNAKEMHRILKDDGIVLKIVPNADYLKELREALGMDEFEPTDYHFKLFEVVEDVNLKETLPITQMDLENLVAMTPLSQHQKLRYTIENITIDLKLLVLRKKVL